MKSLFSSLAVVMGEFSILLGLVPAITFSQDKVASARPRMIQLNPVGVDSSDVFKGPPETYTMRSGYMVLGPNKSVGKHNTRNNEEALIIMAGTGEMSIAGGPTFRVKAYSIAYCPPNTEHNVTNVGTDTLRYVWLVAKAKP